MDHVHFGQFFWDERWTKSFDANPELGTAMQEIESAFSATVVGTNRVMVIGKSGGLPICFMFAVRHRAAVSRSLASRFG